MQTLRKKNSPCKFKNEPTRFLGEGVSFKAKLIGILEVSEARGDRMCQAALADLKMAIRAAGEHKQRIAVQVSIDGLRLRDEKSGDCLYHHPVHKISFIAQDMSDSRAFGYIFGSPDTGHRFFGIKTDKAASQVVIAMRDLFQVVFELKKKEIELAKQHIEQNAINAIKFHTSGIFVEPAPDTKGGSGTESSLHRIRTTNSEVEKATDRKNEPQSGVIADLLDLQFELNSLQQGIHQMDKITPENPLPSTDDLFETDPFGDSFANMKFKETVRPILPPPPSSSKRGHLERQQTIPAPSTSSTSSSPAMPVSSKTPPPPNSIHWFDKETENLFNDGELATLAANASAKKEQDDSSLSTTPKNVQSKSPQIDVFTELDPLGTGLIKPYVDKKDFFQHLKNPPKKVLKDLVSTNTNDSFPTNFNIDPLEPTSKGRSDSSVLRDSDGFEDSNFANFDRFDEDRPIQNVPRAESPPKKEVSNMRTTTIHHQPLSVSLPPEDTSGKSAFSSTISSMSSSISKEKDSEGLTQNLVKLPSPKKYLQSVSKKEFDIDLPNNRSSIDKTFPVDFTIPNESPASPLKSCSSDANSRLSSSSAELDLVPEPPPRGVASILINPPPLPPKKQQGGRGGIKPPPRPPHNESHFHYDFLERRETSPSPDKIKDRTKSPTREIKSQFDDNFIPSHIASKADPIGSMTTSAFEDSFNSMMIPTTTLSSLFTCTSSPIESKRTKPKLDITLSQLTSTNLGELAASLDMSVSELTNLTLQQLTDCLAKLSTKETNDNVADTKTTSSRTEQVTPSVKSQTSTKVVETSFVTNEPTFKPNFEQPPQQPPVYDKYAVFRELLEQEQMKDEPNEDRFEEEETCIDQSEQRVLDKLEDKQNDGATESIVSLVNLTVKLPPVEDPKEEPEPKFEDACDTFMSPIKERNYKTSNEDIEKEEYEMPSDTMMKLSPTEMEDDEDKIQNSADIDDSTETFEEAKDDSEILDKTQSLTETIVEESSGLVSIEKVEVKPPTTTSNDRYAALREIIGEPEPPVKMNDEEISSPKQSPNMQTSMTSKSLAEVELLNLFSDPLPPPTSPKQPATSSKDEDLKAMAMDIFEEIKMLNTDTYRAKETKIVSGFEDVFCPFPETKSDDNKDENWVKFDTCVFSDRSSGEGPRSVGGTSPWSPDGKEFHRDAPNFKGSSHRHSGDSDNEWKDEEESEESNGRTRGEGRFPSVRHTRFDSSGSGPGFDDRTVYAEVIVHEEKRDRDRSFRDRMDRRTNRPPWSKCPNSRMREPSPAPSVEDERLRHFNRVTKRHYQEEEVVERPRTRYASKMPLRYKEDEEPYDPHWKRSPKPQRSGWSWSHDREHDRDHGRVPYYDEERKRTMTLWSDEDRFGSQESMRFDDDPMDQDRWSRRKYDRRRWDPEESHWNWSRRGGPEGGYPSKDGFYCYHRTYDWSPSWDDDYSPAPPPEDSPRLSYSSTRKRHWPKRPNSANEGRNNAEVIYAEPRTKFNTSRSECSDNDSDPYLRPSQRSRSRDSYWGSDQEYDSWMERSAYWSEGPEPKSEPIHMRRAPRHKPRIPPPQTKTQSPFEDDFAQSSVEQIESPATENLPPTVEARVTPRTDLAEPKREVQPTSPSAIGRCPKDIHLRREGNGRDYGKRSSFFEDDLTPTASASSDASDRQRASIELKATPEEQLPPDNKDSHRQSIEGFPSEESNRDSFFNGDLRFDDDADAFAFKSELEDTVQDQRVTSMSIKNSRQSKYSSNNNNNNKTSRTDQYIRKSESVNIFVRENDPFDDDDFFN